MNIWQRLVRMASKIANWLQRFVPGPRAKKGAVVGAFLLALAGVVYSYSDLRTGFGQITDMLIGLLFGMFMLSIWWVAIALGLTIARRIPRWFPGAFFVAFIILMENAMPGGLDRVAIILLLASAVIGGSVMVMTDSSWREARKGKRIAIPVGVVLSVASFVIFFVWLGKRGSAEDLVKVEDPVHHPVTLIDAPDPSLMGPFPVVHITYGSGEDRRPEFGEEADLLTDAIDAKPFVGRLSGWKGRHRNNYWGFDRRAFPLNGRVWYPEGEGPFPLVLVVHGNHSMRDYSDPGYTYLGEHLASHGYIFVSVDENFINGDWSKNYSTESDGRGWIMLEHLSQWREWNAEEGHLFDAKVDIDRVALIGHSRGGEAVAVAAAFNELTRYPDDASVEFDYGFNIRGVVGIAPVDGQYTPADQRTPLSDINYFLLHGSHDGDVSSFSSDRQYKRLSFTGEEYRFKSSIYIYRANHGQFNSVWGDSDWGKPGAYLLNREEFITGEEQRQIAKVYIHAFLDVVIRENDTYLPLFRDFRTGEQWLPETYYINRFEDSETRYIADYDEDIELTTASLAGTEINGAGLADWKEQDQRFRGNRGDRENQLVYLGWRPEESEEDEETASAEESGEEHDGGEGEAGDREHAEGAEHLGDQGEELAAEPETDPASYSITLPEDLGADWDLDEDADLLFSLAQPDAQPSKPDTTTVDLTKKERRRKEREDKRAEKAKEQEKQGEGGEETDQEVDEEAEEITGDNEEAGEGEEGEGEDEEEDEEEEDEDKPVTPLDLTIRLVDGRGEEAAIPLSEIMRLLPPLKTTYMRIDKLESRFSSASEATLQSIAVPLSRFTAVNSRFTPRSIRTIEFVFDQSEKGVILLDEIGFRAER